MIVQADAARLPLADASVHCVVTSPPYWGLRHYDGDFQERTWPDGWRGQLGLEPTPESYLDHMRTVFREIRRVLRPDGTLWLNMGDKYANDGKRGGETGGKQSYLPDADRMRCGREKLITGLPPKSCLGLPWRLAFALQADGWILRSEVIWYKRQAMPASYHDRPTLAHEHVFLLSKSARYFYDWYGTREPASGATHSRGRGVNPKAVSATSGVRIARNPESQTPGRIRAKQNASFSAAVTGMVRFRRLRSVWSIAGDPYRGAHYACFPRELARRCIAAGTSEHGVCPSCGALRVRVIERSKVGGWNSDRENRQTVKFTARQYADPRHVGWRPSCKCAVSEPVPALVLDPFGGSGTVGEVAAYMGRRAVLVDVGYQELQRERLGLLEMAASAAVKGAPCAC